MNSQPPIFFSGKLLSLQCNFHFWDQTLKFRRESKCELRNERAIWPQFSAPAPFVWTKVPPPLTSYFSTKRK